MRLTSVTLAAALPLLSCAGFHQVERGEWKLVYVDGAQRGAEAAREVITREQYETEVAGGEGRGFVPPAGFEFPWLHETETIGMTVNEVQGFRVDEKSSADLFVDGSVLELYWGPLEKHDSWQGDIDVTVRESALYLKAKKQGVATLRLVRGNVTRDIPVTVK